MDFIGVDLGGTRIKAGLITSSNEVRHLQSAATPDDGEQALKLVIELIHSLRRNSNTICGVGLAVPGLVDDHSTVIDLPGKLPGLIGRNLRAQILAATGLATVILNDALAYALGEVTVGAGRGANRVVVVTIGTGIGVGVVERGAPLGEGPLGAGIMGGQIPISDGDATQRDTSGRTGTIEALCAARRLVDYANAAGGLFESVPQVLAAQAQGDAPASAGVARFRDCLARALTALAQAHAPAAIIVGGGPITAVDPILTGLQARVQSALWQTHRLVILPAALGDAAALLGARQQFLRLQSRIP